MIKSIFWDSDGVLVDTEHLYFEATVKVMSNIGVMLTKEMYVEHFLIKGKGAWHLAEEKGYNAEAIAELREERNELYGTMITKGNHAIDGVKGVIEKLHGCYKMGVVTSSRKDHFEMIHKSTGLLKYFDFVLAKGDYPKSKPNPDPYLLAVERSGFEKEECIAVEDSERGLTAAKNAGIKCFVIPTGLTSGSSFTKADGVLSGINEIIDALKEFK